MIMVLVEMMMVVKANDDGGGRDDVEAGYREILDRRNRPGGGGPLGVDRCL